MSVRCGDTVALLMDDGVICGWYGGQEKDPEEPKLKGVWLGGVLRVIVVDYTKIPKERGVGEFIQRCERRWSCSKIYKVKSPEECEAILLEAML